METNELSSSEIKNLILNTFRKCAPPLIFDKKFIRISKKEARKIIRWNSIKKYPYYPELFDCNSFSLVLRARVAEWQLNKYHEEKDDNYKYPIFIGSCLIEDQKDGYHAVDIILLNEGFFYIEPQNDNFIEIENPNEVLLIIARI